MSVQLARRRFTVEEYYHMAEADILTEDDRVELIDGEIVEMTAIGSRPASPPGVPNRIHGWAHSRAVRSKRGLPSPELRRSRMGSVA